VNWDAAAAIGEIVGALAVVLTLAFLAVQVRQGQRAQRDANSLARSAAVDKAFEQFADHRRFLASDSEAMRIWIAGCAGEKLEEIEVERFRQLAINYVVAYRNWEQRAAVVNLPAMAELADVMLKEDLDLHPGLRPVWNWIASRRGSYSPHLESRSDADHLGPTEKWSSAGRSRDPSAV